MVSVVEITLNIWMSHQKILWPISSTLKFKALFRGKKYLKSIPHPASALSRTFSIRQIADWLPQHPLVGCSAGWADPRSHSPGLRMARHTLWIHLVQQLLPSGRFFLPTAPLKKVVSEGPEEKFCILHR